MTTKDWGLPMPSIRADGRYVSPALPWIRKAYWSARGLLEAIVVQHDGLRIFVHRAASGAHAGEQFENVQRVRCAAAQELPFDLPRNLILDMEGLPDTAEVFFVPAADTLASWGILVPAVDAWNLVEVRAELLQPKRFAVLLSFETAAGHRGQGLYPRLLRAMCDVVHDADPERDVFIWCLRSARASARGIEKAGFSEVVHVRRPVPFGPLVAKPVQPDLQSSLHMTLASH